MKFKILIFMFLFLVSLGVVSAVDIRVADNDAYTWITSNTNITVQTYNRTWLEFDGIDDYVTFGDHDDFSPWVNGNSSTYSLWVKVADDVGGIGVNGRKYIFGKGSAGNYEYALSRTNRSTGGATFAFDVWELSGGTGINMNLFTNYTLDEWYHVAVVFDGEDSRVRGYINGIYQADMAQTKLDGNGTASLQLASRSGEYFNGSIDDFKVYTTALGPMAVAELYKNSQRGDGMTQIPVFMHHKYVGDAVANSPLEVNYSQLVEECNFLNATGYKTITIEDYWQWRQDNFTMPEKPVIFTWDDYSVNQWLEAAKVMANYSYKSVMSLTTAHIFDTGTRNWTTVNTLINDYNWSIVSHSDTHCHMGSATGGTAPTWCNTTETRRGNMSASKVKIMEKTGITPRALIFPWNDYGVNSTEQDAVANDCLLYYDLCFGGASQLKNARFIDKDTNQTHGALWRIEINNATTPAILSEGLNESFGTGNLVIHTKLDENQGTTAYDVSGNENHGTISGATWNNDGSLVSTFISLPFLNLKNNFLQYPLSLLWNYLVNYTKPDVHYIFLNNTNPTNSYKLDIYNLTNALIYYSNNSIAGSSNINSNDGNINITLPPNNHSYVLNNFNLTEGISRQHSPLWFSSVSSGDYSKTYKIASNLSDTINVTIDLDDSLSCSNLKSINYTSELGTKIIKIRGEAEEFCDDLKTGYILKIDPASNSNILVFNYYTEGEIICHPIVSSLASIATWFLILLIVIVAVVILVLFMTGSYDSLGSLKEIPGASEITEDKSLIGIIGAFIIGAILISIGILIVSSLLGC